MIEYIVALLILLGINGQMKEKKQAPERKNLIEVMHDAEKNNEILLQDTLQ